MAAVVAVAVVLAMAVVAVVLEMVLEMAVVAVPVGVVLEMVVAVVAAVGGKSEVLVRLGAWHGPSKYGVKPTLSLAAIMLYFLLFWPARCPSAW